MIIEIHDAALEARLHQQMEATGAASAEEALGRLLDTQQELDRWLVENRDYINAKIRRGIEQLERGEGIPGDVVKERLQHRKTAWLKQNPVTKP
jgi:hypothetical protein